MHLTKKESRCGNCGKCSVKLHKKKKHTKNVPKKSFLYAALRTR